ncbi:hypothetical protein N7507_002249 [Penicillium longicatenatum]|nr:hypothetical protein N7507_002249 [Penicillium longicatenatum]
MCGQMGNDSVDKDSRGMCSGDDVLMYTALACSPPSIPVTDAASCEWTRDFSDGNTAAFGMPSTQDMADPPCSKI